MMMIKGSAKRIALLDLWRTAAIVTMIIYHLLIDLCSFGYLSAEVMFSPGLNALQCFISHSFILLAGISSRLSRSNLKRGTLVLLCSLAVSLAGYLTGSPILFGVLQLLSCSMIIYGLLGKYIERLPRFLPPLLWLPLFFLTRCWTETTPTALRFLFPLGFIYPGFYSADWFPLFPWLFMFLLGAWLGGFARSPLAEPLRRISVPGALLWPGRHSLIIYMAHQPLLYGAVLLLRALW